MGVLAFKQGISKEEFLKEIKWHQEQDRLIRGTYFKDGRGCAIGCSLNSVARIKNIDIEKNFHINMETYLGIPEWLAHVEDKIFEGVPLERSKVWPVEFAEAINEGADLDKIKHPFLVIILKSCLNTFDHDKYPDVKKSIERVISFYENTWSSLEEYKKEMASVASVASASSAASTAYAAYAAASAAVASAAVASASYADAYAASAASAASSAASTAYAAYADASAAAVASTAYAAYAAASTTYAAYADASAAYAANSAYGRFEYFADELLRLIKECK